jgi:hypothetical protein
VVFLSGDDLDLEVKSRTDLLSVRNVGSESANILDIVIHNSDECSTLSREYAPRWFRDIDTLVTKTCGRVGYLAGITLLRDISLNLAH